MTFPTDAICLSNQTNGLRHIRNFFAGIADIGDRYIEILHAA